MGAHSPHDLPHTPAPGGGRNTGQDQAAPGPQPPGEPDQATEPADDHVTEPGDNGLDGYQPL
jgi:hypothetical protein